MLYQGKLSHKLARVLLVALHVVFALVIILSIIYGIDNLTKHSHPKATTTSKPRPKSNNKVVTRSPSTVVTPNFTSTEAADSANTQLTNTGPGESELIIFVVASTIGTASHYSWRKLKAARQ